MVLGRKMRVTKELLHGVSTTSLDLPTVLASPNSNCFPLHSKLERQHSKCGTLGQLVLHIYLRNKLLIMPKHLINHSNMRINKQIYLRTIAFVLKINLQPTVHNILVLVTIHKDSLQRNRSKNRKLGWHTFPQNSQKYLECWDTSIFLICLRKLAPYLVPVTL